jgi:hypothetical protein
MVGMVAHPALASSRQAAVGTAPFCAACLDAGIVRPAEIADHIVPHRDDVNSSPTLAQHHLDMGTETKSRHSRSAMVTRDAPSDDASA